MDRCYERILVPGARVIASRARMFSILEEKLANAATRASPSAPPIAPWAIGPVLHGSFIGVLVKELVVESL
jgi:hypothetical protein